MNEAKVRLTHVSGVLQSRITGATWGGCTACLCSLGGYSPKAFELLECKGGVTNGDKP